MERAQVLAGASVPWRDRASGIGPGHASVLDVPDALGGVCGIVRVIMVGRHAVLGILLYVPAATKGERALYRTVPASPFLQQVDEPVR